LFGFFYGVKSRAIDPLSLFEQKAVPDLTTRVPSLKVVF